MSNAIQTVPRTNEVEFIPFGSEDRIKLNVSIVQKFVAIPTKSGKLPSETDCIKFMMLCRSRKLNPFEGDCFLQGYDGRDTAQFSLITAHQAFLKRAEVHPEFDGMESGVIVRDGSENIVERMGDFMEAGDELLGGWAIVFFKSRKHPMKRRLNLGTFKKPYGRWNDDPAGMIVKCAEADALRSSFPTMLGGLYSEQERPVIDVSTVKSPDFGPLPARIAAPTSTTPPTKPQENLQKEAKQPETPQAKPSGAPQDESEDGGLGPVTPPAEKAPPAQEPAAGGPLTNPVTPQEPDSQQQPADWGVFQANPNESDELRSVRLLLHEAGLKESQLLAFCRGKKMARDGQKLNELSTAKLKTIISSWPNIVGEVKGYL